MKLKAWQLVLILALFCAVLFMAAESGARWRQYRGPDLLRVSLAGELYVAVLDKIVAYDKNSLYYRTIDLQRWGIEQSTGGFDMFSNGDILLLQGSHEPGLLLKLLTFLRMEKLLLQNEKAVSSGRRLVRCSSLSGHCEPLAGFDRTFSNTFRVLIDEKDRIFLADTARDTVSWLASDGAVLDEVRHGFRFPNQISLENSAAEGERLLVANTNRNEITVIPLRDGKFAAESEWQHMAVNGVVAAQIGHIWPLEVVSVAGFRYVLQQDTGMAHGVIVKYNSDGEYVKRFTMPEDSDVMSLVWFDNALFAADYAQQTIWRYDTDGNLQGSFSALELDAVLHALKQQQEHYRSLEKQWWWAFALLMLAGFALAIAGEYWVKKRNQQEALDEAHIALSAIQQQTVSDKPALDDPSIHWLKKDTRKMRFVWLMVALGVALVVVGNILIVAERYAADAAALHNPALHKLLLLQLGVIALLLSLTWVVQRGVQKQDIGVLREWVILRDFFGKQAIGRNADVILFPSAIAIDGVLVNVGLRESGELSKKSLYDPFELQQWLAPRLMMAQEKSGMDLLAWYFRYKPVQSVLTVLLAALLIWLK